jgi:hypothetical protein
MYDDRINLDHIVYDEKKNEILNYLIKKLNKGVNY